ncbi:EAL domain-containing protein [Niallia taxi]|uniref:putative bifunctional diguanylate cyclase/phosphodiesterase n=1 Tax=Niallia taxi TaxID=2499688 RepID=UPI00293479D5|nr:EAL domain-containing protein [Niallia taxi]WOD63712.1 EAL domain-containing protein [Niallia taxi]
MKNTYKIRLGIAFIFIYTLFYYSILLFGQESHISVVSSNFLSVAGALISSTVLFYSYRKSVASDKVIWFWFAVGTFTYFIGDLIWMYQESILHRTIPFPDYSDIFYVLQIFFYLIGLIRYFSRLRNALRSVQLVFEMMIIMIAAFCLSYYFIIEPLLNNNEFTGVFLTIAIGYPLGDLALLTGALLILFSIKELPFRSSLSIIIVGLLVQIVSDTGYMYSLFGTYYNSGSFFDPLFTLSLLIVSLSSMMTKESPIADSPEESKYELFMIYIPYAAFLILIGISIWLNHHHYVLAIGSIISVLLIIARQIIILTRYKRLLKTAAADKQKFMSLFKYHPDAAMTLDLDGTIIEINDAFVRIAYEPVQSFLGASFFHIFPEKRKVVERSFLAALQGQHQSFEVDYLDNAGNKYYYSVTFIPIYIDKNVAGVFVISKDITNKIASTERIQFLAYHDSLTGLANRAYFEETLKKKLDASNRGDMAVIFIDFDRFKVINDSLGHDAGDELLVSISARLSSVIRRGDILARLGGDEFVILLMDIQTKAEIIEILERMMKVLAPSYFIKNNYVITTPSMGVSLSEEKEKSAVMMMKQADIAMYYSKKNGKNQYNFYQPGMEGVSENHLRMEQDLHHAIVNNEFKLYYQPQVDTLESHMYGVEALIRWQHPKLGMLTPFHFIDIAEETNLIIPIGEWIVREACRQGKEWHDSGLMLQVSINISPKQFQSSQLVDLIADALEESGFDPSCLIIEITEAIAMNQIEKTVDTMYMLKKLGVRISIDDFGTGHSSLSYLTELPIDALKIPREFVQNLGTETNNAIVHTIITLANNLNLKLVAEGVEQPEQLQLLQEMGCSYIQGYLFSKPILKEDVQFFTLDKQPLS